MVNAGAIMVSTLLVKEGKNIEDLMNFYIKCSSMERADIDLPLYKDESLTGSGNHALRSLMLARGSYPPVEGHEAQKKLADDGLDFYFSQCSMLVDVEGLARFGAMLANGGINPSTGERCVGPSTVKATVTLMQTCGMYDGAGKYTKDHGVPTKSGVAGGLMTIIPGIGCISSWSPPLNEEGNSVRGIGLIAKLSSVYSNINLFHKDPGMKDLTRKHYQTELQTTIALCNAASDGDLETVSRLAVVTNDINAGDYDSRTPLHLAASKNHINIVKFLVDHGADVNCKDRWGATPLADATDAGLIQYLTQRGATKLSDHLEYTHLDALNVRDDQFRLFFAAYKGHKLFMQTLYILSWQVNHYDYDGRTALGIAASEGHLDCVKYLVHHGAKLDHKDCRGNTALDDAKRENRTETVAWLEEYQRTLSQSK